MAFDDKDINDFLRKFLANIKDELPGNSFKFSDFEAAFNNSKISLSNPEQYLVNDSKEMPWIDEFKKAIQAIIKIVSSPRFHIISFKEPLNIERITKVDNQDIISSYKKDAYWQNDKGNLSPKKFETTINEKDISIYENRFVVYVVDLMIAFINENIVNIRKNARFVSQNFSDGSFSYSDSKDMLELANFKHFTYDKKNQVNDKKIPLLTGASTPMLRYLDEIYEIRKDLQRITFTDFYQTIKKGAPFKTDRVYATNLLVGDNSYRTCYNFYHYLVSLKWKKSYRVRIYKPWYYDFVCLSLLMVFKELGFSFNQNRIMFDDVHHLILQNYNCEKDGVKAHIFVEKNIVDINFTVQYLEGKFHKVNHLQQKRNNRICLIMLPNPINDSDEEAVKEQYSSLIKEKLKDNIYTNAFIVSPHNEYNFPNAVIVSPFVENIDLSLKNVIQSCLIFVEGDSAMYNKVCPICGARVDGEHEDGNCHCPECNSIWTALISGDNHKYQNTIWFKSIKRNF